MRIESTVIISVLIKTGEGYVQFEKKFELPRLVLMGLEEGSLSEVEDAIGLQREVTGLLGVNDGVLDPN
jgi:hypothetical protein